MDVENALTQLATGKRDLLSPDECRKLALKLGVPDCYHSKEPEPEPLPPLPAPPRITTTAYGDFTLPWRHDSFTHPAWGHVVHRVLSADNCEVCYGPAEVCDRIVELSQGTDGDRDCAEWYRLSTYVQAKFELAKAKDT